MSNIIDYINFRGDLSFSEREFNYIDGIILAQFVFFDLKEIIPTNEKVDFTTLRKRFYEQGIDKADLGLMKPLDLNGLFDKASTSHRFSKATFFNYIDIMNEAEEMQMSAVTVDLPSNIRCVVFCGTGDTLIAWKEDFNFIYKMPTPSQRLATSYLEDACKGFHGDVYVLGHSKGGNLTLYSAVTCNRKTRAKITKAISYDGPGLNKELAVQLSESPIYDKIINIIPEGSIVGRLFEHPEETLVIKSVNIGLYQHDAFMWQVCGEEFEKGSLLPESDEINDLINNILTGMTETKRFEAVEALYAMLNSTNSKTLLEVSKSGTKIITAYTQLNANDRKLLTEIAKKLLLNKSVRRLLMANIREVRKAK